MNCKKSNIFDIKPIIGSVNKNQNFIQKFRLENQIKQLPGMLNVAYSLPILSFKNKAGDIQKDFSFFVRV